MFEAARTYTEMHGQPASHKPDVSPLKKLTEGIAQMMREGIDMLEAPEQVN